MNNETDPAGLNESNDHMASFNPVEPWPEPSMAGRPG